MAILRGRPSFWIATWFCTGLSPFAPGTVGTLATLPLHFALLQLTSAAHLAIVVAICILGFWSANDVARVLRQDDPSIVVVDESAGILLALWVAGAHGIYAIAITALLFRAFDILKPWPISAAERLRHGGLGIMADDLVAGLAAGLLVRWLL